MKTNNTEYKTLIIDNAVCSRRFHLVYEDNPSTYEHVTIKCPHCSVILFEDEHHSPVTLAREENLVQAPMGDKPVVYQCDFLK